MEPPKVEYNNDLYKHIRSMRRDRKSYMMCDLDMLGQGAAGTTYTAYVIPRDKFPDPIVLKEQKRNRFCLNEFEALKYLREQMIAGNLPGYYIFMYGCFTSGGQKYIILERADKCLDDYLADYDINTKTYLQLFWHIASAVSHLEELEFNHGDLWSENVMLNWLPDQEDIPEEEKDFYVKLIDYDSAFKPKSQIKDPSYGGADEFRKKFILGYDLNRFFDSLIYSHESFIEKKTKHKKAKIARLRKLKKRGKKVTIPSLEEQDESDEEFDAANIIYPQPIIDFMYKLGPSDPNVFDDCPDMSGEAVMKNIEEYAAELGIDLYSDSGEESS
jgi:serine/threonine protein kinase